VDKPTLDEPALDKLDLDEPALDELALDELALDEPALDEPVLEEADLDELALDEETLDKTRVDVEALDEPRVDMSSAAPTIRPRGWLQAVVAMTAILCPARQEKCVMGFVAYDCDNTTNQMDVYYLLEPATCPTTEDHHEVERTIFSEIVQMKKDRTKPVSTAQ
jgi:hypothetical protein